MNFNNTLTLNCAMTVYCGGWDICEPIHSSIPEMQQHYLLYYIIKGRGKVIIGDKERICYEICENTVFIIKPGMNVTRFPFENGSK